VPRTRPTISPANCTHAQEELDLDLLVHRLALEIWREHGSISRD